MQPRQRGHHISGGVESQKRATVEAAQTRNTAEKRLFDSGGRIGVAAQTAKAGHAIVGATACPEPEWCPAR